MIKHVILKCSQKEVNGEVVAYSKWESKRSEKEESYIRPKGTPNRIWCCVCKAWKLTEIKKIGESEWPPNDLKSWQCGVCKAMDSMTYRWGSLLEDKPIVKDTQGTSAFDWGIRAALIMAVIMYFVR